MTDLVVTLVDGSVDGSEIRVEFPNRFENSSSIWPVLLISH